MASSSDSTGVWGGVRSGRGVNRLGWVSAGAGVLGGGAAASIVFVHCRERVWPRDGLPGRLKWMVLGRKLGVGKREMISEVFVMVGGSGGDAE
jgi:hypothetical protein